MGGGGVNLFLLFSVCVCVCVCVCEEWATYNSVLRHRFMCTHYIVWVTMKT